jgi:hypothetical protein
MTTEVSITQAEKSGIPHSSPVIAENFFDIRLCFRFPEFFHKRRKFFPDDNFNPGMFRQVYGIIKYEHPFLIDGICLDRGHAVSEPVSSYHNCGEEKIMVAMTGKVKRSRGVSGGCTHPVPFQPPITSFFRPNDTVSQKNDTIVSGNAQNALRLA